MWTWSLNWGEVTPSLIIGSCPMKPADQRRIKAETGATAALSLQHDECLAYWGIRYEEMQRAGEKSGMTMVRYPMRDFDIEAQRRRLPGAIASLANLQNLHHRTYVHCTAGLGRSPLTVLGFLTLVEGLDPEQAIRMIKKARPGAVPAWEAYHGCRADLLRQFHNQIEQHAYGLYQAGINENALQDWKQAEAEVLRRELLAKK
ncbi:MAG: dual specificity protein phosphatase family protein [Candidatus Thiodiazotropha sp.]